VYIGDDFRRQNMLSARQAFDLGKNYGYMLYNYWGDVEYSVLSLILDEDVNIPNSDEEAKEIFDKVRKFMHEHRLG
jgi:hypothetical protein